MSQSRIPVRYAKALFALGKEKNQLEIFRKDMDLVAHTCTIGEFKYMLDSPVLSTSKKNTVLTNIFSAAIDPQTMAFILLLIKNKRESYLADVARNFIDLYRDFKNIQSVNFTSAIPIDNAIRNKIIEKVKNEYKSEIELHEKVDASIIGGFILKVGDNQYDASISGKLLKAERKLKQK